LIKKLPPPTADRCERRLFPPEQSLVNDKIDRPTIYYTETKRRNSRSAVTLHHVTAFCFAPLTRLSPSYDLVSQQQVSCVLLLNLQTNFPSFTVQQQDGLTSLPVSLHIICAPNTGHASNAAANRARQCCFHFHARSIQEFDYLRNPCVQGCRSNRECESHLSKSRRGSVHSRLPNASSETQA
jgi:hypothetical protein